MPIKWTPELDSILLHGVFEECNISFSKALCTKLAERVSATGLECSGKAVENRLYSWKKKNVSGNAGSNGNGKATPAATPTATPKKSSVSKTPRSRAKAPPKKPKSDDLEGPGNSGNDTDEIQSPTAARGKRARTGTSKPSYAESESEDELTQATKKIKAEPVDAEDAYLNFDGEEANDDDFV